LEGKILKLILLEPYRTALFSMGVDEGLVPIPKKLDRNELMQSNTFKIGADNILRKKLCQLLIMHDDVSIIHYETQELQSYLEDEGIPRLSAMRLYDRGLVTFLQPPQGGEERITALKSAEQTLEGIWSVEKPLLELWEPAIIGQLQAKGKLPHPSLYYLLKAKRLGKRLKVEQAFASVPNDARAFGTLIIEDKIPMWDLVIFSTMNELIGVEEIITGKDYSVASEAMHCPSTFSVKEQPPALDIYEIVVEELLTISLRFPSCHNLAKVESLRKDPDVIAFRNVFSPWLTSFSRGDVQDEKRLRNDVRRAVRAFEYYPYAYTLGWLLAVVALPLNFFAPITATVSTILGMGLPALAERWKLKSQWTGICSKK
jgi:hypothetical protein